MAMDGSDRTFAAPAVAAEPEARAFDLAAKVDATPLQTAPFDYIYMENIFPPSIYRRLLANMPPTRLYRPLRHKDAMQADGSSTRGQFLLYPERLWFMPKAERALWQDVTRQLRSQATQDAFKRKFRRVLEERFGCSIDQLYFHPQALLVRDRGGYKISIHQDSPSKAVTVQFYMPKDESQAHLGTIFHDGPKGEEAERTRRLRFVPSSGYAFAVQATKSWHSVAQTSDSDGERNSLMLIYLVQTNYWHRVRTQVTRALKYVTFLLGL